MLWSRYLQIITGHISSVARTRHSGGLSAHCTLRTRNVYILEIDFSIVHFEPTSSISFMEWMDNGHETPCQQIRRYNYPQTCARAFERRVIARIWTLFSAIMCLILIFLSLDSTEKYWSIFWTSVCRLRCRNSSRYDICKCSASVDWCM